MSGGTDDSSNTENPIDTFFIPEEDHEEPEEPEEPGCSFPQRGPRYKWRANNK